jgi:RNA polymerase sigma-70 factor (ECF subfamily)
MDPQESSAPALQLERFRSYLRLVAKMGIAGELRGKVDASDVVQQTFLEAHRAQDDFKGTDTAQQAAWLKQILARNLLDARRALRRDKRDIARERSLDATIGESSGRMEDWLLQAQTSPSGIVAREERVLLLAEALAALPEDEQEALLLRYCRGYALEAVGEELGVTRKVASRLLRQGMATLRRNLRTLGG